MAHWRDTYRPAKFFFMDARAAIPLLFALLHITWWTIGLAIATMVLFTWFGRLEMDVSSALRYMRSEMLVGKNRPAKPLAKYRRPTDYDRRPV